MFGRPVVSLELVDPRFYHLDTALARARRRHGDAPADRLLPGGLQPAAAGARCRGCSPTRSSSSEADAVVLGLNAVSDGRHVVLPAAAVGLAAQLRERGYEPVPVDLGELLKAGGSVKCCTMELHR